MDWTSDKIDNNSRGPYLKDLVQVLDVPDGADAKLIRMIGPGKRVAKHMLPVFKQDGTPVMNKYKQQVKVPKICLAYNHETDKFDKGECPYCKIDPDTPKKEVHQNVIDREIEENKPGKLAKHTPKELKAVKLADGTWHVKEKDSKSWTPCRLWVIKGGVAEKTSAYTKVNKKKMKDGTVKIFPPQHPRLGFDMYIAFDNSKAASDKWSLIKDEKTQLDEEQLEYLLQNINAEKPEELEVAKAEAKSFAKRMKAGESKASGSSDDDDDADDEKPKKKTSKKKAESDDDWDSDEDFEDDDDKPKKKKRKVEEDEDEDEEDERPKKKKKPVDDDFDDDDEDEKPKKKSSKSKKSRDDDDDDDDAPFDTDEDDDEDEKPKKKKKKPVDDDEDEEEERPVKKKKRPVEEDEDDDDEDEKPKKKKKKPVEDEDDDDEDELPKKKKTSKKSKKEDWDDDDDWD